MSNFAAIRLYDDPTLTRTEVYGALTHTQLRRTFLAELAAREALGLTFDSPGVVRWAASIMAKHGNRKRKRKTDAL